MHSTYSNTSKLPKELPNSLSNSLDIAALRKFRWHENHKLGCVNYVCLFFNYKMSVQTTEMLWEHKWTNLPIANVRERVYQVWDKHNTTTGTHLRTLHVVHQLLHCWYIASGASHVQWSGSLAVFGRHINGLAPHLIPICLQQQPDQLATGGLCFRGTFLLDGEVGAPWKVTCCKV